MINFIVLQKIKQFIKFGITGICNNIIFILVYYIMLSLNTNYMLSNISAYICSSIIGYYLNKVWVFKLNNKSLDKSILKYYAVYGSSFLINVGLTYILVENFYLNELFVPYIILCVTIPYNFLLNKLWVYKDLEEGKTYENNAK